ncbi:MAG: 16S rRNA (cytidine(1402)-2'-O)-methyltransferase [Candidatus Cloacimonadaceae bacterium]
MSKGILYLVPTPIGNLGDITYRAVEVLKSVDLIAAEDTRTSQKLLKHYDIKNKIISYHKFNERKQTKSLIDFLEQGKSIAVITDAGTPAISDPASILVRAAIEAEIQVTCLPGATALIPALAASGLDTNRFTFTGFLPAKKKDRTALLNALKVFPHTIVLYESSHHILETVRELSAYFNDRKFVLARELSKLYETIYRGHFTDLEFINNLETRGEFVILISGKVDTDVSDIELLELIEVNSGKWLSLKELSSAISEKTGVSRNRIYKLALDRKK